MNKVIKPPLGIMPRWRHDELRGSEIIKALVRYDKVDMVIPPVWIEELNEINNRKIYYRDMKNENII